MEFLVLVWKDPQYLNAEHASQYQYRGNKDKKASSAS